MEILLPKVKYTHEIVGTHEGALLPERAPGACSGGKIARVFRPLKVAVFSTPRVNFLTAPTADGFSLRHTLVMKFSYCLFAIAEIL